MAPKRGAKPPPDNDDSDDNDKPSWDSNERNLMLYLLELKRWLPRQHPQLSNFLRFGFIINSRQQNVVFDIIHRQKLQDGTIEPGTFEKPYP